MKIKFLQLNMLRGKYLDAVVRYIKTHDFDIVCLQEVAGGEFRLGPRDCFEELVAKTGLEGQLAVYLNTVGNVSSYIGNAILYKRSWKMNVNHVVWMKRYAEIKHVERLDSGKHFTKTPRCALTVVLERDAKKLMVINTHLAWGSTPNDAVYKKNQAQKLYNWIKTHAKMPFILSGDFNLNPRTMIVQRFSRLGTNLTTKYGITNTLNPRTHHVKALFPSGIAVDYVIVDKRMHIESFRVEGKVDLSDHFGLVGEFRGW